MHHRRECIKQPTLRAGDARGAAPRRKTGPPRPGASWGSRSFHTSPHGFLACRPDLACNSYSEAPPPRPPRWPPRSGNSSNSYLTEERTSSSSGCRATRAQPATRPRTGWRRGGRGKPVRCRRRSCQRSRCRRPPRPAAGEAHGPRLPRTRHRTGTRRHNALGGRHDQPAAHGCLATYKGHLTPLRPRQQCRLSHLRRTGQRVTSAARLSGLQPSPAPPLGC